MTEFDGTELQSCIDPSCDRHWDDHSPNEQQQCSASAELNALQDLHDAAELRSALASEPEWARAEIEGRQRRAAEVAVMLSQAGRPEAER